MTPSAGRTLFALALVAVLGGCSSLTVSNDWNREVDFSSYRTYTWLERTGTEPGDQLPEHLDIRLRRVADDVLTAKGLEPAPVVPAADLLITYYFSLSSELRIDSYAPYGAWGYGYWPGYAYATTSARTIAKGTLMFDIVDRRTKQLVWTGSVQGAVQHENPPSGRVEEVVEKLLATFPPAAE